MLQFVLIYVSLSVTIVLVIFMLIYNQYIIKDIDCMYLVINIIDNGEVENKKVFLEMFLFTFWRIFFLVYSKKHSTSSRFEVEHHQKWREFLFPMICDNYNFDKIKNLKDWFEFLIIINRKWKKWYCYTKTKLTDKI